MVHERGAHIVWSNCRNAHITATQTVRDGRRAEGSAVLRQDHKPRAVELGEQVGAKNAIIYIQEKNFNFLFLKQADNLDFVHFLIMCFCM